MTSVLRALEPRDRVSAARTWFITILLASVATLGWEVVAQWERRPGSDAASAASAVVVVVLFMAVSTLQLRLPHRVPILVWPAIAALAPLGTLVIALTSEDASASGQLGLIYAVVYAASQFRPPFAWGVTVLAVACDAVIVFSLLDLGAALRDVIVVGCSLPLITAVLVTAGAQQARLVERLDALATTDSLTGLATRRALEDAAVAALAAGRRGDRGPHVGLVLVDVDDFKQINDSHGHPAGDAVLMHLASVLRSTVGTSSVAARLGGDELAVLVRGDAGAVARTATALHAAVLASFPGAVPQVPRSVTVSVGHASAAPGWSLDDLYSAADQALYRAKTSGRNRVVAAPVR